MPGQQTVSGFSGSGLVNSFIDFDGSQGTLTSPAFTVTRDYVNLLVAGGAHPHQPGAGDGTPPAGRVLGDFEAETYGAWTATGDFAGTAPFRGGDGRQGERIVDTFFGARENGDNNRGTIVSPDSTSTPTTSASWSPAAPSRRPRSGCWSTAPSCAPPRAARPGR